jgi:hypothetical protein
MIYFVINALLPTGFVLVVVVYGVNWGGDRERGGNLGFS